MKRLILSAMLLATPAMAQRYTPLNETLLHQAESCESAANGQIGQMSGQIDALTKERDALIKERDALKAPKTETPAPAPAGK